MMGYGARQGVARATHDPVHARALYAARGGRALLLVELEVCLLAPDHARLVRERVAARTGVAPEAILVGATHTHSGPETGYVAALAGRPPPAEVGRLAEKAALAAMQARDAAVPAALGSGRAAVHIGRNRRRADGPLDAEALVIRIDRRDGGPLAVLFGHGCHPTVLGHENLDYSADWPGAALAAVEAAHPEAVGLFFLGAHADVDPRTRGVMDLAVEGQSLGVDAARMVALGREAGLAVAEAAHRIRVEADAPVGAAATRRVLDVHVPGPDGRRAALEALDLPADDPVGTGELYALASERTRGLPAEERRERIARARTYLRDRTAARFAGGAHPAVEVQLLQLGDALLLGLPAEPTVDVGLAWKARAPSPRASLVGIANGWLRYLPHPDNFAEPGAHRHYEVLMSTFAPDAALRLLEAGEELAAKLERPA